MYFRLGVQRVYKTVIGRFRTQNPYDVLVYPDGLRVYLLRYAHPLGGAYYIPRQSHSRCASVANFLLQLLALGRIASQKQQSVVFTCSHLTMQADIKLF